MRSPSRNTWKAGTSRGTRRRIAALVAICSLLAGGAGVAMAGEPATLSITSSAFAEGGGIPRRFTCDGLDVSPPLAWRGVPAGARSLVLVVEDPDAPDPKAPRTIWTHWILYDLPASATGLPEAAKSSELPAGTREGENDWKRRGYGGPCPPIGRHRYFFRLFALDEALGPLPRPDRAALLKALVGHVLARAALVGTYQRSR